MNKKNINIFSVLFLSSVNVLLIVQNGKAKNDLDIVKKYQQNNHVDISSYRWPDASVSVLEQEVTSRLEVSYPQISMSISGNRLESVLKNCFTDLYTKLELTRILKMLIIDFSLDISNRKICKASWLSHLLN